MMVESGAGERIAGTVLSNCRGRDTAGERHLGIACEVRPAWIAQSEGGRGTGRSVGLERDLSGTGGVDGKSGSGGQRRNYTDWRGCRGTEHDPSLRPIGATVAGGCVRGGTDGDAARQILLDGFATSEVQAEQQRRRLTHRTVVQQKRPKCRDRDGGEDRGDRHGDDELEQAETRIACALVAVGGSQSSHESSRLV